VARKEAVSSRTRRAGARTTRGAVDGTSDGGTAISEKQLKRFLDLLDAVRTRDLPTRSGVENLAASEIERDNSAFGYEVISALTGRSGSGLAPFARTLARITRTTGELQIELLNPDDPTKPLRPPNGSEVKVLVKDVVSPVSAVVGDDGKVPVPEIQDTQVITGLVIRDQERRPIAVAGRVAAVS
jgi:hypothetical protein